MHETHRQSFHMPNGQIDPSAVQIDHLAGQIDPSAVHSDPLNTREIIGK